MASFLNEAGSAIPRSVRESPLIYPLNVINPALANGAIFPALRNPTDRRFCHEFKGLEVDFACAIPRVACYLLGLNDPRIVCRWP
jgi:hypothetical protein